MKRCLVCNGPSESSFCPTCAELEYAESQRVECPFSQKNKLCNHEACRYYPAGAAAMAAPRPRLAIIEEVA